MTGNGSYANRHLETGMKKLVKSHQVNFFGGFQPFGVMYCWAHGKSRHEAAMVAGRFAASHLLFTLSNYRSTTELVSSSRTDSQLGHIAKKRQKTRFKKFVKLMAHNCDLNDLTNFECKENAMSGNGSYVFAETFMKKTRKIASS